MAGDDLESWIRQQLDDGFTEREIREALLEEGIGRQKINQAISASRNSSESGPVMGGEDSQQGPFGQPRGSQETNPPEEQGFQAQSQDGNTFGSSSADEVTEPQQENGQEFQGSGSTGNNNFPPKDMEYAGLGKRAVANVVDTLWLIVGLVIPFMIVTFLSIFLLPSNIGDAVMSVLLLLSQPLGFIALFGYFIYFEANGGQTPGKKLVDIRVVTENGGEPGYQESAIRNVLRLIDALFLYVVGLAVIMMTEHDQRIGDLAAKTVVVKE
ncbi:MAG: RDD family protein [Candidatus Nanohaloarchaea archaeon]